MQLALYLPAAVLVQLIFGALPAQADWGFNGSPTPIAFIQSNNVRRQGFWHQRRLKLRESSAHLVDCIMRRACCDASVAFRVSFV